MAEAFIVVCICRTMYDNLSYAGTDFEEQINISFPVKKCHVMKR